MEERGKIIISVFLCLILLGSVLYRQDSTGVMNKENEVLTAPSENLSCIDSLLQVRRGIEKNICFPTDINTHKEFIQRNNEIQDWLSDMKEENLSTYTINSGEAMYLLFISTPIGATGVGSNFYSWLLIDYNKGLILKEIMSLSRSTRSLFVENGKIHFIVFKFGDDFFFGVRDFARLPITVIEYVLSQYGITKITTFDIICSEI